MLSQIEREHDVNRERKAEVIAVSWQGRSVLLHAHTPVRTAEIWEIYIFLFLKAFLSLNHEDW